MQELNKEIENRVSKLTRQDWDELFELYKEVVNFKGKFSTIGGGTEIEDNVFEMPFIIEAPIVAKVRNFFCEHRLVVIFDWSHWDAGKAMFLADKETRFKDATVGEVIKLFIAVMRNDRFCEGAWANLFEDGNGSILLTRLLSYRTSFL